MRTATRGKIYLILGITLLIISVWFEIVVLAAVSGVTIAWSYWYWWRTPYIKRFYLKDEKNLKALEIATTQFWDELGIECTQPLVLRRKS